MVESEPKGSENEYSQDADRLHEVNHHEDVALAQLEALGPHFFSVSLLKLAGSAHTDDCKDD